MLRFSGLKRKQYAITRLNLLSDENLSNKVQSAVVTKQQTLFVLEYRPVLQLNSWAIELHRSLTTLVHLSTTYFQQTFLVFDREKVDQRGCPRMVYDANRLASSSPVSRRHGYQRTSLMCEERF